MCNIFLGILLNIELKSFPKGSFSYIIIVSIIIILLLLGSSSSWSYWKRCGGERSKSNLPVASPRFWILSQGFHSYFWNTFLVQNKNTFRIQNKIHILVKTKICSVPKTKIHFCWIKVPTEKFLHLELPCPGEKWNQLCFFSAAFSNPLLVVKRCCTTDQDTSWLLL